MTNIWPDHYPDKCPPNDASYAYGKVYRFTNRSNPKHKDFLSYYELQPLKDWGAMACNARGLSVYATEEDCIAAAAAIPALRKKSVCVADLNNDSGMLADTPSKNTSNHKTFWTLLSPQDLANLFSPVSIGEKEHV